MAAQSRAAGLPAMRLARHAAHASPCRQFGAVDGGDEALATAAAVAGPDGDAVRRGFLSTMFTAAFPRDALAAFVDHTPALPGPYAAQFVLSVTAADFRDPLPHIRRPTLSVGGGASRLAQTMPWIAAQIAGAQLVMIDADAGHSHFMFLENPAAFAAAVQRFLGGLTAAGRS